MYGPVCEWDVRGVSDMSKLFFGAKDFNEDIGGWCVRSVTNMRHMFCDAPSFDQDIGGEALWKTQS